MHGVNSLTVIDEEQEVVVGDSFGGKWLITRLCFEFGFFEFGKIDIDFECVERGIRCRKSEERRFRLKDVGRV